MNGLQTVLPLLEHPDSSTAGLDARLPLPLDEVVGIRAKGESEPSLPGHEEAVDTQLGPKAANLVPNLAKIGRGTTKQCRKLLKCAGKSGYLLGEGGRVEVLRLGIGCGREGRIRRLD